jgi:uncharacterized Rmd1/YagE family protein
MSERGSLNTNLESSSERLPLLDSSKASKSVATTSLEALQTPLLNEQQSSSTRRTTGVEMMNSARIPPAAPPAKRIVKQSRPRKAVSEFRKKVRHSKSWTGRIGVTVKVDEIKIEMLSEKIAAKINGWTAVDYYDAIRLWQTEPPYIGHEQWADFPVSDDETNGMGGGVDLEGAMPEVYIFSFGAVVFWNFPSKEFEEKWLDENILKAFPECLGEEHSQDEIESALDEMAFAFGENFSLKRDVATLTTREWGEKLAVSFALAKSSLLSVYEERVQRAIERNSHIPEEMAKNGRIRMSRQEISKEVGRMFLVKHGINLDQSLIDTPEGKKTVFDASLPRVSLNHANSITLYQSSGKTIDSREPMRAHSSTMKSPSA